MPKNPLEQIRELLEQVGQDAEEKIESWLQMDSPKACREFEMAAAALGRKVQDGMTAVVLQERLGDPEFQAKTSAAARSVGKYRHGGQRSVEVSLLGGSSVVVDVDYLKPDRRGLPGPRRRSGKRGKGGSGLYPALVALGVIFGTTPALAAEVCNQVTESDSFRAGLAALSRHGINLGHKRTHKLVNDIGQRANEERHKWLKQVSKPENGPLAGKRVVVATDGGRLRERKPRRRGPVPKGRSRRRFDAPWRETKMLVIYTIDDQGRVENEFRPVYDGTLGDCEVLYTMLGAYLEALGAHAARELIVVGDGAEWIWNRTDALRKRLGLQPEQLIEVIDWYHAVEALDEVAKIPAKWSSKKRKQWMGKVKKLLYAGDIDALVEFIQKLAQGRRRKAVNSHVGYFRDNSQRMQYATFKKKNVPLGSGAVESMIRRVVNLRLKGNAKFWLAPNAEGMILFRSYLKAERLDDLLDWSFATIASWWPPAKAAAPSTPLAT